METVMVGGAFRVRWVSSGAVANSICFNIRTDSETAVSSYGGVDSGNGFYYADVRIDSPGLWKGEWFAYVAPNTYHNADYYEAFAGEVGGLGRYIDYDEIVLRYPTFENVADAVKAGSHYIAFAEAEVDARLGAVYSPPFNRANLTVRDLAIDIAYLRSIRAKTEEYDALKESIDERIDGLLDGSIVMVTSGGVVQNTLSGAWSNTQNYHPIFTVALPIEDLCVDSLQYIDEATERGYTIG